MMFWHTISREVYDFKRRRALEREIAKFRKHRKLYPLKVFPSSLPPSVQLRLWKKYSLTKVYGGDSYDFPGHFQYPERVYFTPLFVCRLHEHKKKLAIIREYHHIKSYYDINLRPFKYYPTVGRYFFVFTTEKKNRALFFIFCITLYKYDLPAFSFEVFKGGFCFLTLVVPPIILRLAYKLAKKDFRWFLADSLWYLAKSRNAAWLHNIILRVFKNY